MNKYLLHPVKFKYNAFAFIFFICLMISGIRANSQGTCATASAVVSTLAPCSSPIVLNAVAGAANGPALTPCPTTGWSSNGWAQFTAVGTTTTIAYTYPGFNAGLWVYSGTCAGLTQIACADDYGAGAGTESVTVSTVIGSVYYVRVSRKAGAGVITGSLCVTHAATPANDEPCTPTVLGALPTSCSYTSSSTTGATISTTPAIPPAPGCAGYIGNDVWFTTNASAAGNITVDTRGGVTTGANMTNGGMAIYTGTCGALVLRGCDDFNSANPGNMPYLSLTGLGASAQVWIRVWANNINSWGAFDICAYDVPVACNAWDNPCTTPISLTIGTVCTPSAVFNNTCATNTTGTGLGTPTCAPFSYSGADVWFKIVAPAGGQVTIQGIAGSMTDAMMALYSATGACPALTFNQLYCDDDSGPGLMPQIDATGLTVGATYYVRVWGYFGASGTFQLCAYTPCTGPPANDDCTAATPLTLGAACPATFTNACASTSSQASPGCANFSGNDVWFSVVVPASGTIIATGVAGGITDGGMAIYSGTCPGGLTLLGCDDDSGPGLSPELTLSGLTPSSTIYIRYWKYGGGVGGTFGLCVSDPCPGGVPANDQPCAASFLPYNVYIPGTNGCATNINDPASLPACFTNNGGAAQYNTVWYRFIATSTCTKIKTSLGTLNNTQIAVYSGAGGCGSLGAALACNNDVQPCGTGSFTYQYSQLDMATTIGTTYYIMVDGVNGQTGTFSIQIINGVSWTGTACSASFPPITGQDCVLPLPVCSATINVANPGFQGVGNVCDFPPPASPTWDANLSCSPGNLPCATSCLAQGERGSAWYDITIAGAGPSFLEFNIVPNDYTGTAGFETDYDFELFGPYGSSALAAAGCSSLNNPIRCSYSALGVTGINGTSVGQAPALYAPNYNGGFRERVNVLPGEHYLLNVSNFSVSASGFTLNFAASSIATTVPPGSTLIWTGAASTLWGDINNWGGCQLPDCRYNVLIPAFPTNQPVIGASDASCRNIDIAVGATLTINTNRTLMVCNNFTNNGTFTAALGTTVLIQDTCTTCTVPVAGINHNQTLTGAMTAANRFPHLTTVKPAGFGAIAVNDLDVGGNFTVSGAAGFGGNFNATGQYQKVAGNFTVQAAPVVATYTPAATLEFNGAGTAQTYLNRGFLKSVVMNQSGALATATVTLQDHLLAGTPWMQLDNTATSNLTLTYGKIVTALSHATDNRVDVLNTATTAVTTGNTNSFVQGTLRRYLLPTGSYDFPMGTSAKGYLRMNFNLNGLPAGLSYWDVFFNATVPASPTFTSECSSQYHNTITALNHGWWDVLSSPSALGSGTVTPTAYNKAGDWTNTTGAGWTIQYNNSNNNAVPTNWALNPFPQTPACLAPPVTAVTRTNMVANTLFPPANTNPIWFASAQSLTPLPVKLLSFDAKATKNSIKLNWATATEEQNKGFELQRTITPPDNFDKLAWLDGHGTTTTTNYYNFEDKDVKEGVTYYYRLKQEDFNGNSDLSNVVAANIGRAFVFNVIPNPYSGSTNITYNLQEDSKVKIEVMNVMGQRVATIADAMQESGTYRYDFSAKLYGYSSGIYTIRVLVNDQVYSKRVLEKD